MKQVKLAGIVASVLILGACQQTTERKAPSQIVSENAVSTDSSSTASYVAENKTQYPLTITTYGTDGSELETVFEKAPDKALAVYQGSIETMLALGLESKMVAAAGLDNEVPDHQKAAFSQVNYLDEFTPSKEVVVSLEPDFIFSWGSLFADKTLGDGKEWVDNQTNIYVNTNTRKVAPGETRISTLENEYTDILNIGKIFDVQSKAQAIVDDMKGTIERVVEKTQSVSTKPKTLVLEFFSDEISNHGQHTLGGDMVLKLGGELLSPDAKTLGKEDIVAANPDVIFVAYMPYTGDNAAEVRQEKLDKLLKDEAFASLDAVKNGRVVPILLSEMYASATRTKDGIVTFAKGLYPTVDLGLE